MVLRTLGVIAARSVGATPVDVAMLGVSTYIGHGMVSNTYSYLSAVPELMDLAARRFESYPTKSGATVRNSVTCQPPSFAALVQPFFTEYRVAQRAVSQRTVGCYRDALKL